MISWNRGLILTVVLGGAATLLGCGSGGDATCTSTARPDGSVVIQCGDGAPTIISPAASQPCTVSSAGDGTHTVSCPDGTSSTVRDGANGTNGADGTNGTNGADGANGTNGSNGTDGADGANVLLRVEAATTCATSGNTILIGRDNGSGGEVAGDGVLGAGEVEATQVLCDGQDGANGMDGTNGTNGADGTNGQSVALGIFTELPGATCEYGGTRLEVGVDANGNGALDPGEADPAQTGYLCNSGNTQPALRMAVGDGFSCAMRRDEVWCWGSKGGAGGAVQAGLTDAQDITAGKSHVCIIKSTGAVYCEGTGSGVADPVASDAVFIEASLNHSCAVLRTGAARCWGDNYWSELGDGGSTSPGPVDVNNVSTAVQIGIGRYHAVALLADGSLMSWGNSVYGQLGQGSFSSYRRNAQPVSNLTDAVSLSVGYDHVCVIRQGGTVSCWGYNNNGQLGIGSQSNKNVPTDVPGLSGVVELALGFEHTCARLQSGNVKCWGRNSNGQLGDGTTAARSTTPVDVVQVTGATRIISSYDHTCAELDTGAVKCWGKNNAGQLGDGTTTDSPVPVTVGVFQ